MKMQVAGHDGTGAASRTLNGTSLKLELPSPRLCWTLQAFRELNAESLKVIPVFIREQLRARFPRHVLDNLLSAERESGKFANLHSLLHDGFPSFDAPQLHIYRAGVADVDGNVEFPVHEDGSRGSLLLVIALFSGRNQAHIYIYI